MQKVLTAEEMREVDRLTTETYGIPSILLMENAAHAAARVITEKLGGSVKGKKFLILCGKGNNGGDGAALARILWMQGAEVHAYLFGKLEETKGDAKINFQSLNNIANLKESESYLTFWAETDSNNFEELTSDIEINNSFDVLVDAFFGTGLVRPLEKGFANLLNMIFTFLSYKEKLPYKVSLDLPSGLNADMAETIGENLQADLTVTFTAPKLANVFPPVSNYNGELFVANIGSPQELVFNSPSQLYLAEKQDAQNWLYQTKFTSDSYKNRRGHALLIAGSRRFTGAAVLCADACLRTGVGLVTLATPKSAQGAITARLLPEVMTVGVSETDKGAIAENAWAELKDLVQKSHVVAIGSGLSSEDETTRKFVREAVIHRKTPVLLDADGLNALSPFDMQGSEHYPLILTPHKGEMRRLLGLKDQDDLGDLVTLVRDFAQKHQVILVLKGERALIAEPGGKVVINPTGNSGLGKGGNGDTLAGIITGFLTQAVSLKVGIFETVVAAVYVAGLAGDMAAEKFGKRAMSASDVRECLVESFRQLEEN